MKRTAFRLLAVVSLAIALAAPAWARTRPRFGGTLRAEMRGDPAQWETSPYRLLVFDTLTEFDEAGRVRRGLAARWDSQNDGRRWQFWLNPGIRFHDGTPLSPATVVQSLTSGNCSGCPWKSVRVLGESILFESDVPLPELPALLAGPARAISRSDSSGNQQGTGPFRVANYANGTMTLAANEDSWRGQSFVSAIEIRGGRPLRDQWLDVSVGRADIAEVPPEQIRRAQQEKLNLLVSRNVDLLAVLVSDSLQRNSSLTQAVALSFDRSALYNVIFQKQGEITADLLPNWLTGYAFLAPVTQNLTHARELRAQLNGQSELLISCDPGDSTLQLAAERLALNLRDAGFTARVLNNGNGGPHLRLSRLHVSSLDPAAALDELAASLHPPFSLGDYTAASTTDLSSLYKINLELLDRRAVIPLMYLPRAIAVSPRVRDLVIAPDGSLRSADFWLEDGK